jgi:MFS family permease
MPMTDRWRALWVLSAARVAMGFQFQAVGAVAPVLRDELGLGLADIGWLVGIFLLPGVVLALPGGMLSARFGDRRIAIAGMALMTAGGVVSALSTSLPMLEAGRLLGGIGGVLFNVTASRMIADWFVGHEIEWAMSIFVSTWPIGIGLALLSLGGVADAVSVPAAFAVTAVLAAGSLALIAALYRPAPGAAAAAPPRLSVLTPREWRLLGFASAAWCTYNVAFALLAAFLPTLFALRGIDPARAGAITAVLTVTMIVSIHASGWLVERTGQPVRIAVGGLLAWTVLLPTLLHGEAVLFWVALAGLASGTAAGVLVSAPARFLSPVARPMGLGVFYTLFYLGMALLPRAVGAWADAAGAPERVVHVSAALSLLTVVLLLCTAALMRSPAPPTPRPAAGS